MALGVASTVTLMSSPPARGSSPVDDEIARGPPWSEQFGGRHAEPTHVVMPRSMNFRISRPPSTVIVHVTDPLSLLFCAEMYTNSPGAMQNRTPSPPL